MNYDDLFPGRFLRSSKFKGKDATLIIKAIRTEKLPGLNGDVLKGIVAFEKTDLELVLNRTNGECFKAMFGRETDGWIGKRVTLWPAPYTDNMTGEVTTAIRVRGSPDIASSITFELRLARKKPTKVTLLKTTTGAAPKNGQAPQPTPAPQPSPPQDDFPSREEVAAAEAMQSADGFPA